MRWNGDNIDEIQAWVGQYYDDAETQRAYLTYTHVSEHKGLVLRLMLWVEANRSALPVVVGEWIIRDEVGFYPCQADVFAKTYEAA